MNITKISAWSWNFDTNFFSLTTRRVCPMCQLTLDFLALWLEVVNPAPPPPPPPDLALASKRCLLGWCFPYQQVTLSSFIDCNYATDAAVKQYWAHCSEAADSIKLFSPCQVLADPEDWTRLRLRNCGQARSWRRRWTQPWIQRTFRWSIQEFSFFCFKWINLLYKISTLKFGKWVLEKLAIFLLSYIPFANFMQKIILYCVGFEAVCVQYHNLCQNATDILL